MKKILGIILLFVAIALFFFYPIFKGNIPFPGDLLIGEYAPYNTYPFQGYAPGAYPNKGQDFDVVRLIYPGKEFAISQLKKGQLPLWNPYNFSGNPHMASMQSGSFYPFNILFFFIPFIPAWSIYIILQTILASLFTFLLLREYKLSKTASVFGAIAFAYSSYVTVWVEFGNLGYSFLWLPLILLLLHKNILKPTIVKTASIGFILALTILAGYIQTSIYAIGFAFVYALFVIFVLNKEKRVKNLLISGIAFTLGLLLSFVQLLPTFELFMRSTRSPYSKEALMALLIPFYHLVTIIIPDFFGNPATRNYWLNGTYIERVSYVGILPLFFAVFSFFKKPSKLVMFYALCALAVFLMVFDTYITRFLYSIYIPPIISTGVPSRMMYLFCFPVSILAAFGIHEFEKNANKKKILILSGIFLITIIAIWGFVLLAPKYLGGQDFIKYLSISKRNLIIPTGILLLGLASIITSTYMGRLKKTLLIFIILITILDLFYFFQKITPFVPVGTVYPKTEVMEQLKNIQGIDRSWGYGSGVVQTNLQEHEKIYGTDIYDALHLNTYGALITSGKNGKIEYPLPRSEATIPGGYGSEDLKSNPFRKRLLDLLGVKYILNKTDIEDKNPNTGTFPEKDYLLVWAGGKWQIYQNKGALPRIYFVSKYMIEGNQDKAISLLMDSNFDLRDTVVLSENLKVQLQKDPTATIKLISYTPNEVDVVTNSRSQMLLVLSDNYYPGWEVVIDKSEGKILKTNVSLRSVVVPAGKHTVKFRYQPQSFYYGFIISAVTLISMVLYLIYSYIVRKKI